MNRQLRAGTVKACKKQRGQRVSGGVKKIHASETKGEWAREQVYRQSPRQRQKGRSKVFGERTRGREWSKPWLAALARLWLRRVDWPPVLVLVGLSRDCSAYVRVTCSGSSQLQRHRDESGRTRLRPRPPNQRLCLRNGGYAHFTSAGGQSLPWLGFQVGSMCPRLFLQSPSTGC